MLHLGDCTKGSLSQGPGKAWWDDPTNQPARENSLSNRPRAALELTIPELGIPSQLLPTLTGSDHSLQFAMAEPQMSQSLNNLISVP